MNRVPRAIFILLLLTCASNAKPTSFDAFSLEFDLDGDGQLERIRLDKASDPALSVRHGRRLVWSGVPARWKPWKLTVADVDGDGRSEILVGVYKATRFFPKPHNCLFIYSWDGRRAAPKWLGSSLSRPFTDFAFMKGDGKRMGSLVALETRRDGRRCVAVYSWNGFGFTLDWQQGDWQEARLIEAANNRIILEADGRRVTLSTDEMRNRT
jgi:hypothetical protein